MDHVKAVQDLAKNTRDAQAMTGQNIARAIHTIAAAVAAHFDFDGVQELHTDDDTAIDTATKEVA